MSLRLLCCFSITENSRNSAGLALTKLQNDHAKNIGELVFRGCFPRAGLWSSQLREKFETKHVFENSLEHLDGLLFPQFPKSCSLEAYTYV